MQNRSLPDGYGGPQFGPEHPTTSAVARALKMTPQGVRYLVDTGELACRRTQGRWRTFRHDDVLRLADRRTRLALAGKLPRRRKLGPRGQPRQLALFSLSKSQVSGANSGRKRRES